VSLTYCYFVSRLDELVDRPAKLPVIMSGLHAYVTSPDLSSLLDSTCKIFHGRERIKRDRQVFQVDFEANRELHKLLLFLFLDENLARFLCSNVVTFVRFSVSLNSKSREQFFNELRNIFHSVLRVNLILEFQLTFAIVDQSSLGLRITSLLL